jgi:hypothetical protein
MAHLLEADVWGVIGTCPVGSVTNLAPITRTFQDSWSWGRELSGVVATCAESTVRSNIRWRVFNTHRKT